MSLDALRHQQNSDFLASGSEFSFGNVGDLPAPLPELTQLTEGDPRIRAVHAGGLTATVFCIELAGRLYALKRARPQCLVQNKDGQSSFLNELHRHAEIRHLRLQGQQFPGVVSPIYGSLRHGLVVSHWVHSQPFSFTPTQTAQLFEAGCALLLQGFFEWDFCSGNILHDGENLHLFDFGYMYRFDPLTQINSAGKGADCPQFHLCERIEARNYMGWLLDFETSNGSAAALAHFCGFKQIAVTAYQQLAEALRDRGASSAVLSHYSGLAQSWQTELETKPETLLLKEAWLAHSADLADDLSGKTCTQRTLKRTDWLINTAKTQHVHLLATGVLDATQAALSPEQLTATLEVKKSLAKTFLIA